ncbi:MAG TPA: NAD(P)/FAD-dependent oxidoreductase [Deltaproteobacteria bacterium]|nr:NAD(P)/FAD-dependent oxidoreductase [Deltaproteobacteria bacterium]HOI08509.1 NAD(P)/FAD-dependent oxidoreductase [Deltaproteobacteria bacterium]
MSEQTAVIIGAGPAGLTAAYELLSRTAVRPIVFEMTSDIGGISKTVEYKGNRMDIGGHRFFSKSDEVMRWWQSILPPQGAPARDDLILGRSVRFSTDSCAADPERTDKVMLIRGRVSRIFFLRSFFDYPISLKPATFRNLGLARTLKAGFSYLRSMLFPIRNETSLEDFFINRFGRELYLTFFKDYTEKVWGVSCREIQPDWGAQRVKGLSITRAVAHALRQAVSRDASIGQKDTETSLIEQFLYPKLGPGQLWEEVARRIRDRGGEILLNRQVLGIDVADGRVRSARVLDTRTNVLETVEADYFFSTMPVKDLVSGMRPGPPLKVREVAEGLMYRDFITVGLLLKRLKIRNQTGVKTLGGIVPDNWIYIQERDVRLGRLQIFNNWSPYLVRDPDTVWIGLEYFCNEGDELWSRSDGEFTSFAIDELSSIGIIDREDVLDSVLIRMPKTYPAYFGTYRDFGIVREYLDRYDNLFLIGRNGMHKYNNADHSMLTAMTAVDNIVTGNPSKENIWQVNTEEEYHESREG